MSASEQLKAQLKDQLSASMGDSEAPPENASQARAGYFSRATQPEIANFYRSFSVLVKADYPLGKALTLMANTITNADFSQSLRRVAVQVENGIPLSRAMARTPWYFDTVSISVIKAAEEGGTLASGLEFMAETIDTEMEVREQAVQILTYPTLVVGGASALILGILWFVAPTFQGFIAEVGGEAEGLSAAVFALSDFMRHPVVAVAMAVAPIAAFFGVRKWKAKDPMGFHRALGRVPLIGTVMMKASLARFTRMFYMMTTSGVGILQSLDLAKGAVDNAVLQRAITVMHEQIEQGKTMGMALRETKGLPPVFVEMMSLAEDTGRMDELLPALEISLRKDLGRTARRVTAIIEPVLTGVMGIVVLVVLLSFFVPYLEGVASLSSPQM